MLGIINNSPILLNYLNIKAYRSIKLTLKNSVTRYKHKFSGFTIKRLSRKNAAKLYLSQKPGLKSAKQRRLCRAVILAPLLRIYRAII